jgi:hypothetical protein
MRQTQHTEPNIWGDRRGRTGWWYGGDRGAATGTNAIVLGRSAGAVVWVRSVGGDRDECDSSLRGCVGGGVWDGDRLRGIRGVGFFGGLDRDGGLAGRGRRFGRLFELIRQHFFVDLG